MATPARSIGYEEIVGGTSTKEGTRSASWDPDRYIPGGSPLLYTPVRVNNQNFAQNPVTGELRAPVYVGSFVPNTGDPYNGMATWRPLYTDVESCFNLGAGLMFESLQAMVAASSMNTPLKDLVREARESAMADLVRSQDEPTTFCYSDRTTILAEFDRIVKEVPLSADELDRLKAARDTAYAEAAIEGHSLDQTVPTP